MGSLPVHWRGVRLLQQRPVERLGDGDGLTHFIAFLVDGFDDMVLSILVDVKMVECCLLHIISTTCGEGILAILCRLGFCLDGTTTAKLFITITFAIGQGSWKTYQYVGPNTTSAQFLNVNNWIDLLFSMRNRPSLMR